MKIRARIAGFSGLAGLIGLGLVVCLAVSCSLPGKLTGERYALLIGISQYPGLDNDLTYPVADAQDLGSELANQAWNTLVLKDASATKEGIKSAIKSHFASIPKDGTALIYYAGHGTLSNLNAAAYQTKYGTLSTYTGDIGEAVLVPYDFDNSANWTGGITSDELYSWIKELNTENVIVILDSCFSGGLVKTSDAYDTIAAEFTVGPTNTSYVLPIVAIADFTDLLAKNAEKNQKLAPITISAAGSEESSYEDFPVNDPQYLGYGNGIFTYYLLESIKNGDSNGDGFVTCTEAYTYSARALNNTWNKKFPYSKFYPHITGGLRDLVLFDLH
jgi:hypothetical protein